MADQEGNNITTATEGTTSASKGDHSAPIGADGSKPPHIDEVISMVQRYLDTLPAQLTPGDQREMMRKYDLLFQSFDEFEAKMNMIQRLAKIHTLLLKEKTEMLEDRRTRCMGKEERRTIEVEIATDKRNEEVMQETEGKGVDILLKIQQAFDWFIMKWANAKSSNS